MPSKPLRICQSPGCNTLTTNTYCDVHTKQQRRQYDDRRGTSASRGYDASWNRLRLHYLSLHPLCEICEQQGITKLADLVHHKIRISDDPSKRLDISNLQSLCIQHHDQVHQAMGHKW